jgi:uncharacterized phiE125 gp8 family phage protein
MTFGNPIAMLQDWRRFPIEWALRRTVAPTLEPVTLQEVKDHLRGVSIADEDALLQSHIVTARETMEGLLCKALMQQTLELNLSRFPGWALPLPRTGNLDLTDLLTSVTSVQYIDMNGNTQIRPTSQYIVDAHHQPIARLLPFGIDPLTGNQDVPTYWTPTRYVPNAVTVTYVAGVASIGAVPQMIRQALLMVVGTLYENREAEATTVLTRLPIFDVLMDQHASTWEPEFA